MTVTFIDAPGSRLPSLNEPLDFIATGIVAAISVSFGAGVRAEERAYRDGVFLYPYLRSTKVGTAYSLVRDGGWPDKQAPTVYVDEGTAAPTTFWTKLYEPNLPAWGAAHLGDVGDHVNVTIEGATWRPFGEYGNPMGVGTAQGLKLKGANRTWGPDLSYPPAPFWFLELQTVPGFDAAKETMVLARFTSSDSQMDVGRFCGVSSVLDDLSNNCSHMTASHITAQVNHTNGQPTRMRRVARGVTEYVSDVSTETITANTHASYCVGVLRRPDLSGCAFYGPWAGSFPAVEKLIPIAGASPTSEGTIATLGAAFMAANSFSGSPDWTLTHCKVLQREAA